jgi:ABC-type nitrate/sulfonate/bicarbonate transport system permease component
VRAVRALVGMIAFLAVWEGASRTGLINPLYVPPPSTVSVALITTLGQSTFLIAVASTVLSWLIAVVVATIIGVTLGLLLGSVRRLRTATAIVVDFIRPMPGVALIPVVIALIGTNAQTKISLAVFASIWPILFNTVSGLNQLDPHWLEVARTYRTSRLRIALFIRLPAVAPYAMTGLRLSATIALISLISTEYLAGGTIGLGQYLSGVGGSGRMDLVLADVVVAGLLSCGVDTALGSVHRRLLTWTGWGARMSEQAQTPGRTLASVRRSTLGRIAEQWVLFGFCVLAWQLDTSAAANPYFPTPTLIASTARQLWLTGPTQSLWLSETVFHDILPSLARLATGWLLAAAIGSAVGLALGRSGRAREYCSGVLAFLRALPVPTLVPVLLSLFRIGPTMEIVSIAFGAVWPVLLGALDGARMVDQVRLDTAQVFRITGVRRVIMVIVPSALPNIFAGLRVSLSIALIMMVISELVGSTSGIGYQLVFAQGESDIPVMWAWIVLLGVLGYLANSVLTVVEHRVLR